MEQISTLTYDLGSLGRQRHDDNNIIVVRDSYGLGGKFTHLQHYGLPAVDFSPQKSFFCSCCFQNAGAARWISALRERCSPQFCSS